MLTVCLYICVSNFTMDPGCEAYEYNVTTCLYLCISSCTMDPGCEAYEYCHRAFQLFVQQGARDQN